MNNTILRLYLTAKDLVARKLTRMGIAGATTEVVTLKEAWSKAEDNAAVDRIEREK